jgi:uncharacterized membrane protein YqhA
MCSCTDCTFVSHLYQLHSSSNKKVWLGTHLTTTTLFKCNIIIHILTIHFILHHMKQWNVNDNSKNWNINHSFRLGVSFGNSYYAVDGVNQKTDTNDVEIITTVIKVVGSIIVAAIGASFN